MTTLRDVWRGQGFTTSKQLADQAGITKPTLYKMNRKEKVHPSHLQAVLRILGLSQADYDQLEVCPMADRYRRETDT